MSELIQRIAGEEQDEPIARTKLFVIIFVAYLTSMFAYTLASPGEFPILRALDVTSDSGFSDFRFYFWPAITFLVATTLAWTWHLTENDSVFHRGISGVRVRSIGIIVLYLLATVIATSQYLAVAYPGIDSIDPSRDTKIQEIWFYMIMQAFLVGVIYEVYSHPIKPDKLTLREPKFSHHQANWWKLVRGLFTVILVIVGIMTLSDQGVSLTDSVGEFFPIVGFVAILFFVFWKRTQVYPEPQSPRSPQNRENSSIGTVTGSPVTGPRNHRLRDRDSSSYVKRHRNEAAEGYSEVSADE